MKLWEDDDSSNDEETQRKYVQPTQEEFEIFLAGTPWDWETADTDAKEITYESGDFLSDSTDRVVRIFSTIEERTGRARSKGSDAIRTVIWDNNLNRPVGGRTKTLRIKTWRNNLREKLDSIEQETQQYIERCEECNSLMVIRDGKYGEFYGCSEYPDCTFTKNIE